VLGKIGGVLGCIEYSDLSPELREAKDGAGELLFRAGNIALHALSVDFLDEVTGAALELPWHLARKTMPVVDGGGESVERTGFKFETFVFDALGRTERSVTLEVDRALEFSPVKNRAGEDSPATALADLCRLHAGWVARAGLAPPPTDGQGNPRVEIDPALAETEEEFLARGSWSPDVRETGHHYA